MAEPYNGSNKKHVESRARKEKRATDKDVDAMKLVMSTSLGRHFVWFWLGRTGLFRQPFVAQLPDVTVFNCGRQDVGHQIRAELESKFPAEFRIMWAEHIVEQQKDAAEDEAVRTNALDEEKED